MALADPKAPASGPLAAAPAPRNRTPPIDAGTAAWLCAIPCALLVLVVGQLLGPPLGTLLRPPAHGYTFTAEYAPVVRPEPTEHARYLIALSLPLLIAFATIASPRWTPSLSASRARVAATAVQGLLVLVLAGCYLAQVRLSYGPVYTGREATFQMRYFTSATLAVAALLCGAAIVVLRQARLRKAATALLRESRARAIAGWTLAIAVTALWLLHAVQSDSSLGNATFDLREHLAFTLDETFAVLNGLSPLVDFTAQYSSLWPYATAAAMLVFGKTALTFSLVMCTLTGLALLAIYSVLKRVTRSSLGALLLYLPFLATSLFMIEAPAENRSSIATYHGTFPLRYAGPFLLALLTARHIDRDGGARGVYLLFLLGGVTILNNVDFGVAALGATVAAMVWAGAGRPRPSLRPLLAAAGGGLLTALALVSLLTLLRAGSLPQLGRLTEYARLFGVSGFANMPVPGLLGMHLVIYITYVAAIVVATVCALRREPNRLLTGMLVWAGIFGLGSASYYIGRSHPVALKSTFSVWALALALLTVVVVRELAAHPRRRPAISAVATLFGFGVAACSLGQTPTPWSQIDRLGAPFTPTAKSTWPRPLVPSADPRTRAFVASLADGPDRFVVRHGAPVAIMLRTGHRVADAYGVRNVSPYTGSDSTPTEERVEAVLDLLAEAGGNTMILPDAVDAAMFTVLERRGFRLVTHHGLDRYDPSVPHSDAVMLSWPAGGHVIKWVDTRHLHPEALRR